MSQDNLNQHLVSNVPNIEEFRDFVRNINKMAKDSNSIWRLSIKYRKPKKGHKYGWGGSLKRDNANAFSVYIHDRRPYHQIPGNQYRTELWQENRKLEEENESLRKELVVYKNPYFDWTMSKLEEELFDIKSDIVDRFLECDDELVSLKNDSLRNKYNQVMEMILYNEKNDNR